jgi:hypothetical protein
MHVYYVLWKISEMIRRPFHLRVLHADSTAVSSRGELTDPYAKRELSFGRRGGHAEMSEFFVHCGIKYSLDQASWLNSRFAALASEAGERRGTGASIITGGGILKPNTTNAEFVKA